ncbi:hypothetical protein E5F05_11220 [Deinococcus metallilatus]|uniref:Uncharacterized protein n=1 Tax=Deinococcus metallilatus TaxID=1211322 RepID=A0AAJ5F1V2_9DEIO|nr:hypothetical protein [Deinococcus metallilatus]MBB5296510.1 hypothetical protein [Deinococcus metallilatus]QBY08459.1 hypothetical protein E5F05_11220 [Deinococcus metallilatus]RXJ11258.1 hypothetical protein ERJ73_10040 [Deinococcus metallilatus]TLK24749.1 hypothetical protein FCS05_14475 [Deinococcus metallilatus]GMA17427.1 hypothetical protein GCM10025871_37580 [Deinococcus metallilatus]
MTRPRRIGDLELAQDLEFHRREVRIERLGWAAMLLIVLAALLGLFGSGPLSEKRVQTPDGGLQVKYNRFARYMAPTELRLTFSPGAVRDDQVHIWLSREYLQHMEIQKIIPEPDSAQLEGNRLTYTFNALQNGQPGQILFELQTEAIGRLRGAAGLAGASGNTQEVRFTSFIYP